MSNATTQTDVIPSTETDRTDQLRRIHTSFMMLMHVSKRWFAQRLQSYGLTLPQFVALAALAGHQHPCTMSDLTSVTFHDAPTMTGVIDRLVKMKLVQRTRSETDRRVVLVYTTQAGVELVQEIETNVFNEMSNGYRIFSDNQLADLEQILHSMLRVQLMQQSALDNSQLDAEIEKLRQFVQDPINYVKSENGKFTF
ncbi:MAG: hypothetical protein Kow0031_11780 [Anaerolineae bacterium]